MPKRSVQFAVDADLVRRAGAAGLDPAGIAEQALRRALDHGQMSDLQARMDGTAAIWNDFESRILSPADAFSAL